MRKIPLYKYPIRLNIGSGTTHLKGVINIDVRDCGQEMVWDVRNGLPFPDGSVEGIQSTHFIEHLDEDEAIAFIQECLRVLMKGGQFLCLCPHYKSEGAVYLGHKSFWTERKIDALLRSEIKLPPFLITKNETVVNEKDFNELLFVIKKL